MRIFKFLVVVCAWFAVATTLLPLDGTVLVADDTAHSTDRSAAALQVRDGYEIRLIASEPMIVDPVSARLDDQLRLWVVEMPDYPLGPIDGGPPSGRIKILRDTDGDGYFDDVKVFADGLLFATGIQPYRDGAIVTLAGKIVFMRDVNNDDVVDEVRELFTGFAEQNQQLRANHPTLGPDGMIYVAGGLRGGSIQAIDSRYEPRETPLDLRDRDFCFDPDGGWWGTVAGNSQFGISIDDFGRRFGCSNRNPAMMTPIELDAVDRDPLLAARDAIHNVALAAEESTVVPLGEAWTTSNLHAGQFSAACGVFAPGIEDEQGEWMLTCEPTGYLVQRQRVQRSGSVWLSRREELNQEFLSSSDTWFRPVDTAAGPSQSVYVVDMARAVIEHPDFMPTELKTRPDQLDGNHLGRLWQVLPSHSTPLPRRIQSPDQAHRWLRSDSPWERQMATEYLLRSDSPGTPSLIAIATSSDEPPRARARAAFLLRRHRALTLRHLSSLMTADDARLRALGVELSTGVDSSLAETIARAEDADPLVLRAVARVLAGTSQAGEGRLDALLRIAQSTKDEWVWTAVASVDESSVDDLALRLATSHVARSGLQQHLIQRLAIASPPSAAEILASAWRDDPIPVTMDAASIGLLEAWVSGTKKGRRSPRTTLDALPEDSKSVLVDIFQSVVATANKTDASASLRARCLTLADAAGYHPEDLRALMDDRSPPPLRVAALPILLKRDAQWTRQYLSNHLVEMTTPLRATAIEACSRTTADVKWLLTEISNGNLSKTVIDPATAKRLRQHSDQEVREAATRLLQSDPNRARVLTQYAAAAQQLGDPRLGEKLFLEQCSACHRIDGAGTNVGPDISDTRTKTPESLLTSILDPNAAIDSSFIQYSVLTLDGRILDGLLIDETAQGVTLQQKGGQRVTIARDDIDTLQAPGVSLMPEGFEQTLDTNAMSHLLAYLKNWRYLRASIPGTVTP